ncbi:hypothetical protein F5Y01DRAFT_317534 [Xylaria sp. FL0043]|nr:hypothetical protein F5Y01DRAFT_317534 [Xylaria sp. FL0043]
MPQDSVIASSSSSGDHAEANEYPIDSELAKLEALAGELTSDGSTTREGHIPEGIARALLSQLPKQNDTILSEISIIDAQPDEFATFLSTLNVYEWGDHSTVPTYIPSAMLRTRGWFRCR